LICTRNQLSILARLKISSTVKLAGRAWRKLVFVLQR
jgi:hypothetical protein